MKPALQDTTWLQQGVSALWEPTALYRVSPAPQSGAVSVREFLRWHDAGWPTDEPRLTPSTPLVVAGLEATLDTLAPEAAEEWMRETFYKAVRSFQRDFEGGGVTALIIWLASGQRIVHEVAMNRYSWLCEGRHHGARLPFGSLLWNGAQDDVRQIKFSSGPGESVYAGLFCRWIS